MFIKFNGMILKKKSIKIAYVNNASYQLIIERHDSENIKIYHDSKEAAHKKLNELWELLK